MKSMTAYIEVIFKDGQSEQARELYQQEDLAFIITDIDPLIAATLKGADRVSKIIKDLGNYANPDNEIPKPICIDNLIEQSIKMVANELQF